GQSVARLFRHHRQGFKHLGKQALDLIATLSEIGHDDANHGILIVLQYLSGPQGGRANLSFIIGRAYTVDAVVFNAVAWQYNNFRAGLCEHVIGERWNIVKSLQINSWWTREYASRKCFSDDSVSGLFRNQLHLRKTRVEFIQPDDEVLGILIGKAGQVRIGQTPQRQIAQSTVGALRQGFRLQQSIAQVGVGDDVFPQVLTLRRTGDHCLTGAVSEVL